MQDRYTKRQKYLKSKDRKCTLNFYPCLPTGKGKLLQYKENILANIVLKTENIKIMSRYFADYKHFICALFSIQNMVCV